MTDLVPLLQLLSGLAWLVPALYLSPRIARAWRTPAHRADILAAPIGFMAWLQVGFSLRWLAWGHAIDKMRPVELVAWAALYALSVLLAAWFFKGARMTRND